MAKIVLLLAGLPCLALALYNPLKQSPPIPSVPRIPNPLNIFNDCLKAKFANPTDCAILYDDDGCEGWNEPIAVGYRELGLRRRNDAESIVVKKGCTFTGYQHANDNVSKRGSSITVNAKGKSQNEYQNFKGSGQLEAMISAVECKC